MGIFSTAKSKKPVSDKPKPKANPNCWKCKGQGSIYDSYLGTIEICTCITNSTVSTKVCTFCNDTGKLDLGYGQYVCDWCDSGKTAKEPKYKLDNAAENLAKKNVPGLEIVPATDKQLQLDYDTVDLPERFHKVLPMLRERFAKGEIKWNKYQSASGKHWHVVIDLPDAISNQERILWQAIFGSDYMREGLSLMRLIANIDNPTLLFMMHDRVLVETGTIPEPVGRKFKEL